MASPFSPKKKKYLNPDQKRNKQPRGYWVGEMGLKNNDGQATLGSYYLITLLSQLKRAIFAKKMEDRTNRVAYYGMALIKGREGGKRREGVKTQCLFDTQSLLSF